MTGRRLKIKPWRKWRHLPIQTHPLKEPDSQCDWETDDNIPLKKIRPFGNTNTPPEGAWFSMWLGTRWQYTPEEDWAIWQYKHTPWRSMILNVTGKQMTIYPWRRLSHLAIQTHTLKEPDSQCDWETDDNIPLKKIRPFGNTNTPPEGAWFSMWLGNRWQYTPEEDWAIWQYKHTPWRSMILNVTGNQMTIYPWRRLSHLAIQTHPLKEPDSQCDWETDDNIPLKKIRPFGNTNTPPEGAWFSMWLGNRWQYTPEEDWAIWQYKHTPWRSMILNVTGNQMTVKPWRKWRHLAIQTHPLKEHDSQCDWETDDNIPLKKIEPFGNTNTPPEGAWFSMWLGNRWQYTPEED